MTFINIVVLQLSSSPLILKAGYGYIFFCCLSNYLFVVRACIEVRLRCKISIVATTESTETISVHTAMHFRTCHCVASGGNVEYIRFNLPGLPSMAGSTNSGVCCSLMAIKISNFLHSVQYLLFEIVAKRKTMPRKQKLCPYAPFPAPATALICNIDKITQTKLQVDVKHILVPD